uniref:LOB domain-containing protein n=1 Tax=Chenopodium quinoa TaxID=63459 RepID=A0A803MVY2_CHEQI
MRLYAGLPKCFWADAVSTAAYLINRGPSVPLEFKIPEEEWSGKEVSYTHLKTFGCVAYLQSEKRDKLDPKAIKCYFIGYGCEKYGYRLWDPKNRKIVRHCDITFDESSLYKDNFGGKSVEKESIEDEREFVELDGKVRSDKEVEQVEVEVQIQQPSPQHGAHVPVDSDSSDSDDDDHLETDERVVMGEPVVVHGEPSTPPTGFLEEMGMKQDVCALYSDSQSAVQLAKNPMFHYRTKHIKRRYHYTRSLVKDGTMCLRKIAGSKNPADMLTKAVSSDKLRLFFAPYFCHEQGATHFSAIHKVFGASNVSKLLAHLPASDHSEAAITISYEAQARLQDPIYGCVSHIYALQQQCHKTHNTRIHYSRSKFFRLQIFDGSGPDRPVFSDRSLDKEKTNHKENLITVNKDDSRL